MLMRRGTEETRAFYFANYRLLTDDGIANHESIKETLAGFAEPMPYTHTFTLRLGNADELEEKLAWARGCPVAYDAGAFTMYDTGGGWAFVSSPVYERRIAGGARAVMLCSSDYSSMTVWTPDRLVDIERNGQVQPMRPPIPLSFSIRIAFEAGMAMRDGLPLHASLVEKDGFGVVFLGPCGRGKSTQAKLWKQYLGAEFIIGDYPVMRKTGGQWLGFGMPWDGPDEINRQASVPVRALVRLEKAQENRIAAMNPLQPMPVMLQQVRLPVWDDTAVDGAVPLIGQLVREVPMYRLSGLPDAASVRLTYETICKG